MHLRRFPFCYSVCIIDSHLWGSVQTQFYNQLNICGCRENLHIFFPFHSYINLFKYRALSYYTLILKRENLNLSCRVVCTVDIIFFYLLSENNNISCKTTLIVIFEDENQRKWFFFSQRFHLGKTLYIVIKRKFYMK